MNKLDEQYILLLKDILDNGVKKKGRNGKNLSIFGARIHHHMKDGFPLLTTKKMHWKSIVTELIWFLRGDTNIKYLVDNGCNIWNGDAYKRYWDAECTIAGPHDHMLDKETFIRAIKEDWGLDMKPKKAGEIGFVEKYGDLGPIYGAMWRMFDEDSYDGFDQIAELIKILKTNPDSRRMLITAWHPGYNQHAVLPPCHYGFQVYTRELSLLERYEIMKKLDNWVSVHYKESKTMEYMDSQNIPTRAISLMWNQRSVDVPLGLPFNIASYGLLLEILAKEVNMVPEHLIGNLGDCHIYENQIEPVKMQLDREPRELPQLEELPEYLCKKDDWECYKPNDIKIKNYKPHPKIEIPLSN